MTITTNSTFPAAATTTTSIRSNGSKIGLELSRALVLSILPCILLRVMETALFLFPVQPISPVYMYFLLRHLYIMFCLLIMIKKYVRCSINVILTELRSDNSLYLINCFQRCFNRPESKQTNIYRDGITKIYLLFECCYNRKIIKKSVIIKNYAYLLLSCIHQNFLFPPNSMFLLQNQPLCVKNVLILPKL